MQSVASQFATTTKVCAVETRDISSIRPVHGLEFVPFSTERLIMNALKLRATRPFVLATVLLLLLVGTAKPDDSPTQAIAACMGNATNSLISCTYDLPWYAEWLCGVRWEADIVLCALLGGLPT